MIHPCDKAGCSLLTERFLFGWRLENLQENAVLSYPGSKEDFRLQLPRFEVKPGEVAAIVGRVGSGE